MATGGASGFRQGMAVGVLAATAMALVPQAEAKYYDQAKFKVLSIHGVQESAFTADSRLTRGFGPDPGEPPEEPEGQCIGSGQERVEYRTTSPQNAWVFVKKTHGRFRTLWTTTPKDPFIFDVVEVEGEAKVTRSVEFSDATGCFSGEHTCGVETTQPWSPLLAGVRVEDGGAAVGASGDENAALRACPWHGAASSHFPIMVQNTFEPVVFTRGELFGKKPKLTAHETLVGEAPPGYAPGPGETSTNDITVELKRVKLKPSELN